MATNPITHVSDTARWVAIYRAMESERADALFRDPYARRLGGLQGEAIVAHLPKAKRMAWPMIVRTAVMDEIILRLVGTQQVDTVLNLAAGLDARPWRLDLPPALRWFEVDLPDMLRYKREQMAGESPRCALEFIEADLREADARTRAFERAASPGASVLVVSEGLLVYLERRDVEQLARGLGAQAGMRWWLTDLGGPRLEKMMNRQWGSRMVEGNATFKFFPPEGTAFFEPFGWREVEFRSMWAESLRLKRTMRLAWFWNLLGTLAPKKRQEEFARMSGIVLLKRT